MKAHSFAIALFALLGATMTPLGCRSVVGVESHELIDQVSCDNYCALIKVHCTGDNLQYSSDTDGSDTDEACMKMCAKMDPGTIDDTKKNTVGCRVRVLETFGDVDEPELCRSLGPAGGGLCGSDCENYCKTLEAICPDEFATFNGDCEAGCGGFHDCDGYVAEKDRNDDSLQCRLFHLSSASVDPTTHCPHAIAMGHCSETTRTCLVAP